MLKPNHALSSLLIIVVTSLPGWVAANEDEMTLNVPWAIELLTEGGVNVSDRPNAYEQLMMNLVVQLEASHLEQLSQLADGGNDDAQTMMGLIYSLPNEEGQGQVMSNLVMVPSPKMRNYVDKFKLPVTKLVARDPDRAISYLEKAAAQQNTVAETLLAETIMQKEGAKPDFELSRDYFHRAALKDHIRAQIGLLQVSAILEEDVDPVIMRKIFSEMTGQ